MFLVRQTPLQIGESSNPEYTGGFGLRATFKGFDFSTLFTFADEYYRFNNRLSSKKITILHSLTCQPL